MPSPHTSRHESVLLHYLPFEVLRELSARARRFQQEEIVRQYVLRHFWFVLLIGIVIFLIGAATAAVAFAITFVLLAPVPYTVLPTWAFWTVVVVPSLVAFTVVAIPLLNNLFAWIEANATASNR